MNDKQLIAKQAAEQVQNGMLVGLGTGSSADCFIAELARRQREENLQISTVASSTISAIKAQQLGLTVLGIEQISRLDLYVDGADEVAPDLTLLKGQGADLVREKLLASNCERFIVLVEQAKLVTQIGEKFAIPIEVLPFAWRLVKKQLEESYGAVGDLRLNANKSGCAISSHGSLILDMRFAADLSGGDLNSLLNGIPGIVEHGVFYGLADSVLIGHNGEVQELWPNKQ